MMVGIDAFTPQSLRAFNKMFHGANGADTRLQPHFKALRMARKVGFKVRVGVVVGHIGMTYKMLEESVNLYADLASEFSDVICAADIEVLSPEPGSMEWLYLLEPHRAWIAAAEQGLRIGGDQVRNAIARELAGRDVVRPTGMLGRYVEALTPELNGADLIAARVQMRNISIQAGIMVGIEEEALANTATAVDPSSDLVVEQDQQEVSLEEAATIREGHQDADR